jgi:hypothetical protein
VRTTRWTGTGGNTPKVAHDLTLLTEAKYLCGMTDFAKAKFFSHCFGPLLDCATFDFNGIAAAFAD